MQLPSKQLELRLLASDYNTIVGVDEVGMACLAGPVTVCAVALDKEFYNQRHLNLKQLRDSKQLLPHQRERYYHELVAEPLLRYAVVSYAPARIDELNIYQASRQAMRDAIAELQLGNPSATNGRYVVLVDGPHPIKDIEAPQQAIIKGDRKVFAIACASIIAKVTRDAMMTVYAQEFPGYGFEQHKGYPTPLHKSCLKKLGPCVLHRRSFRLD